MLLAVLIVLSLIAAFIFLSPPAAGVKVMLPDGTSYEVLSVTVGTEHVCDPRNVWEKLMARLPRKFQTAFGLKLKPPPNSAKMTSTNESLGVWFLRTRPTPTNFANFDVMVFDGKGIACHGSDQNSSSYLSATQEISGYLFSAFPRREKKLSVRFLAWDSENAQKLPIAQFPIRNHARVKSAKLVPEPLPCSKAVGGVQFTLTRLQTGLQMNGRQGTRATNVANSATLAAFRVQENGRLATNWEPTKVWMSDATGNVGQNVIWSNRHQGDEEQIIYQWGLWPNEPAWKLRVEFSRTSGFKPEEIWKAQIPATNLVPYTNWFDWKKAKALASTNIGGATIEIKCLRERVGEKAGAFSAEIMTTPENPDYQMTILKVTDEAGRAITRTGASWGAGEYHYEFEELGAAKTLQVELAFHKKSYADFIAKPEPLTKEEPNAKPR